MANPNQIGAVIKIFALGQLFKMHFADSPRELKRLTALFDFCKADYLVEYVGERLI